MTEEQRNAISSRFESWELVELLGMSVDQILDAFEEEIDEHLEELLDMMGFKSLDKEEGDQLELSL